MRTVTAAAASPAGVGGNCKNRQGKYLRIISAESPVKLHCCYGVILVLSVAVIALSVALSRAGKPEEVSIKCVCAFCPRDWIAFGSKCFNFSEKVENWTSSQTFCMAQGAQLARFDIPEELEFLKRYKGRHDHWIGLHRKSSEHHWMWSEGTEYNNLTSPRGEGECAYLIGSDVSSGRNYTHRRWICSKPNSFTACDVPKQS